MLKEKKQKLKECQKSKNNIMPKEQKQKLKECQKEYQKNIEKGKSRN